MADISKIRLENQDYNIKDSEARNDIISINNKIKFITPEQFGAVGDGLTDDYNAFSQMINYVNSIVPTKNFTDEASCKDYSSIKFIFSRKYAISQPLNFQNTYGLNLTGLHLLPTNNFNGDFLLGLTNVNKQSTISNCILNGNLKVNKTLYLADYSLVTNIIDSEFTRFLQYGIYATSKAHEILAVNLKIHQLEYGEVYGNDTSIWDNLASGTGLFLDTQRFDNHFTNIVINYCKVSTLRVLSGSNYFEQCHFYGGSIDLVGNFNYLTNCYFDGSILKLNGLNYIKGCSFFGNISHYIELTEPFSNNWKYANSYLLDNIFRNGSGTTTTPIIFNDNSWTGNENKLQLETNSNSFYQVTPFNYQSPNTYFPAPWKNLKFTGTSYESGSVKIGNLLLQYGTITQEDSTEYINFPTPFDEYPLMVFIIPEYSATSAMPYASDITNQHFWANVVQGKCKWYGLGRMYP